MRLLMEMVFFALAQHFLAHPLKLLRLVNLNTGRHPKPYKTEWATEKDELLYLGSIGKEWVVNGVWPYPSLFRR